MATCLYEEYRTGKQSRSYVGTFRLIEFGKVHTVRVEIKRDAYAFQSHAKVELHNGTSWHFIESLHWSNMTASEHTSEESFHKAVTTDRRILLERARLILKDE